MVITSDSSPRLRLADGEAICSPLNTGAATGADGVFSAGVVQQAGRRVLELLAQAERLTVQAVSELGVVDEAGLAQLWGYRSTERLVTHGAAQSSGQGRDLASVARHCHRHARTGEALAAGEITLAQAMQLARAARGFDTAYTASEESLLAFCVGRDIDDLRRSLTIWRAAQDDQAAAADAEHRWNQRGLNLQPGFDGACRGSFQLDPVGAETFISALETRPDGAQSVSPQRSLAQRRADKLIDICHQSLHGDPDLDQDPTHHHEPEDPDPDPAARTGPTTGSDPDPTTHCDPSAEPANTDPEPDPAARPKPGFDPKDWPGTRAFRQVQAQRWSSPIACNVVIDIETLAGGCPENLERLRADYARGNTPITGPTLDRLLCDATFRALITDGPNTILAYNRATPDIPHGLRRAIHLRDRHCQFPGCDHPGHWCDVHHLKPRHQGGPTNHDNLVLACRHHHGLVHEGGWTLARAPNGTITAASS